MSPVRSLLRFLPAALVLLLSFWVFRGLIAALLPLLVGGFAIVLTFLLLRLVDQFAGLSIFAVNLVTGMGLGLGIDYSLFVLARYREELAGGSDSRAAIARTLQTAGRTDGDGWHNLPRAFRVRPEPEPRPASCRACQQKPQRLPSRLRPHHPFDSVPPPQAQDPGVRVR